MRHATAPFGIILLSLLLISSPASAAPGDLDTTFSDDGWQQTDIQGADAFDAASDVALQPDGKVVLVGSTSTDTGSDFALARYNPDGTLDTTFGSNGTVITSVSRRDDYASGVAIQPNGAIVVAGQAWGGPGRGSAFALVRYLPDGTPDPSFGTDGKVLTNFTLRRDYANAVAIQVNGKIVAVGERHPGDFAIARYEANGTADRSFSGNGRRRVRFGDGTSDSAAALAIQANGRIVVSGDSLRRFRNRTRNRVAVLRLRTDGGLDPTFGLGGKVLTSTALRFRPLPGGVAIQPDGKIVVASTAYVFLLVRYRPNGRRDTSFSRDGIRKINVRGPGEEAGIGEYEVDYGADVTIQPDGRIVEIGTSASQDGPKWAALVRVEADGTTDTSFGDRGQVVSSFGSYAWADAGILQTDGKIMVAGTIGANFLVARYLS